MGMRQYGPSQNTLHKTETPVILKEPEEFLEDDSPGGWKLLFLCGMAGLIFFCALFYFIIVHYVDAGHGSSTPEQAAVSWTGSLTDSKPDALLKYCLPVARRKKVLADNSDVTHIRQLLEESHVSFLDRSVKEISVLSDAETDSLRSGLKELYGANIRIKDARRVIVAATMEWLDADGMPRQELVELPVVCIKVYTKWYIYTGRALSEADRRQISLPEDQEEESETLEVDTPVMFAPEPTPEPFVRESRVLSVYDGARADLEAGKVEIEGSEQVMPVPYENLRGLFRIKEGSEADGMELEPNAVVSRVPVVMTNQSYAGSGLEVAIANTGVEMTGIEKGTVTMLFVSVPDENYLAYPEIWLPGNVTFGTTYNEIVELYGDMEVYEGGDERVLWPNDEIKIYSVQLGTNKHNRLYLHFLKGKLWGLQWLYYDFNSYAGDIA